jgi:hypothetical protein
MARRRAGRNYGQHSRLPPTALAPSYRRSVAREAVRIRTALELYSEVQRERSRSLYKGLVDERLWRPDRRRDSRYGGSIVATTAPNAERPKLAYKAGREYIRVANPKRVLACARREQRRRSMFAKGHAGLGIAIKTRRRRNATSKIRCN